MNRGPFCTLQALLGTAQRDWDHFVDTRTGVTLCGFDLRQPREVFSLLGDMGHTKQQCPDCDRKRNAMLRRAAGDQS